MAYKPSTIVVGMLSVCSSIWNVTIIKIVINDLQSSLVFINHHHWSSLVTIITCWWQSQPLSITHLFIRNAPHFYHQYWVGWLMATQIHIVQYTVGYFFLLISNLVTAYNHWRAGGGDRAQENVLCWNCLNIFNFIMCKIKLYWEVKFLFFHHSFVDCMVFFFSPIGKWGEAEFPSYSFIIIIQYPHMLFAECIFMIIG